MATITITAANVIANSGSSVITGKVAGESLSAGDWVYLKASDGKMWKSSNFDSDVSQTVGLCANTAAANQPVTVISKSTACAIGSVVTTGKLYFLSATAGKMYETSDLNGASSIYPVYLCQAMSASTISFDLTTVPAPAFMS